MVLEITYDNITFFTLYYNVFNNLMLPPPVLIKNEGFCPSLSHSHSSANGRLAFILAHTSQIRLSKPVLALATSSTASNQLPRFRFGAILRKQEQMHSSAPPPIIFHLRNSPNFLTPIDRMQVKKAKWPGITNDLANDLHFKSLNHFVLMGFVCVLE